MPRKKTTPPPFRLSGDLNLQDLHNSYEQSGRIQIKDAFDTIAVKHLAKNVNEGIPWTLHFNSESGVYDLGIAEFASLEAVKLHALLKAIHSNAVQNFQFLFENFSVSDSYQAKRNLSHYVMHVFEYLNSDAFLNFARTLTGVPEIANVNAQLTNYRPGHFLTCHDDEVEGSNRVAAYVIGLTDNWRADWGGLLHFIDDESNVTGGFTPRIGALNIFKVPQKHSVSCVSPFAPIGRLSLSGWFRA